MTSPQALPRLKRWTLPPRRADDESSHLVGLSADPVVSLRHVWRSWGRGKKRWTVLEDVTLDVNPGVAVSISGSNGAGKTTLLRIATGILAPDRGSVSVDGFTASGNWREYHRRIGFVSAGDRGLYPRVTVRGHLEYWTRLAFMPRGQRPAAVEEALMRFGLDDLANRRAERLSQGQRQRLRLALGVVHRPKALLLDEPRNSLDDAGLELLASAVKDLLASGGAVIWCCPAGEAQPVTFRHRFMLVDRKLVRR